MSTLTKTIGQFVFTLVQAENGDVDAQMRHPATGDLLLMGANLECNPELTREQVELSEDDVAPIAVHLVKQWAYMGKEGHLPYQANLSEEVTKEITSGVDLFVADIESMNHVHH